MKKLAALVLILLIAAGAGAWILYSRANAPFRSYDAPELLVSIPQGTGTAAIGARLVDECLRFARHAGYRKVTLWTNSVLTAARRIYAKAGFRLVRKERHRSFGHDLVGETWELTFPAS